MMSKKKWWIVGCLGAAPGWVAVGMAGLWWFVIQGGRPVDSSLTVYTFQQTASTHPGYRRITITAGTTVYVKDYDEYALQPANNGPTHAIGRTPVGGVL